MSYSDFAVVSEGNRRGAVYVARSVGGWGLGQEQYYGLEDTEFTPDGTQPASTDHPAISTTPAVGHPTVMQARTAVEQAYDS